MKIKSNLFFFLSKSLSTVLLCPPWLWVSKQAAIWISCQCLQRFAQNCAIMNINFLFIGPFCLFCSFHTLSPSASLPPSRLLSLFSASLSTLLAEAFRESRLVGMVDNLQHKPPPPPSPAVWSSICLAHCWSSPDVSCLPDLLFFFCHSSLNSKETNLLDISTFGNIQTTELTRKI